MPLTVTIWCGRSPSSAQAFCSPVSTPKSPHPGHQSGSTFPLKSLASSFTTGLGAPTSGTVSRVISSPHWLDENFLIRHVMFTVRGQLRQHAIDDVVRHERLAVIFADVTGGADARLAAQ